MPRIIDTMNGLGEGVWGKPQFHQVNRGVVYEFLTGQALEDYHASGGRKQLTKLNIERRVSQNPIAVGYLSAAMDHYEAHDEEKGILKRKEKTEQLLNAKRALPNNIFSQADVAGLGNRLSQLELDLGDARVKILKTNADLPEQFQQEHGWDGDSQGAGSE